MTVYTMGHSTLSAEDFVKAVKSRSITSVLDIRSHPTSKWEWFWKDRMERWLPGAGLRYEWWPELGGWTKRHLPLKEQFSPRGVDLEAYAKGKFPKQRIGKSFPEPDDRQIGLPGVKPVWSNQGLWDYQFFLSIPEAVRGLKNLIERGRREDVVIVCSEAVPWRCHRSMVSDALSFLGVESYHIVPTFRQKDKVKSVSGSKASPHSRMLGNRLERYEPDVLSAWEPLRCSCGQTPR